MDAIADHDARAGVGSRKFLDCHAQVIRFSTPDGQLETPNLLDVVVKDGQMVVTFILENIFAVFELA
jgi:hypothetical protein